MILHEKAEGSSESASIARIARLRPLLCTSAILPGGLPITPITKTANVRNTEEA